MHARIIGIVAGTSAVMLVAGMGAFVSCTATAGALASTCVSDTLPDRTDPLHHYDAEQIANAATIIDIGVGKQVPAWGWVIAVAAAIQESSLRNLPHLGTDNDHDSVGLFQQRPSQGWGTPQQLADPRFAASTFYDKLLTIPGWQQMPLTDAAQAVQKSAYPDAYAKWTGDATVLVAAIGATIGLANTGLPGCGPLQAGPWTQPVHATVVSGFRTTTRPGHDGVDLAAARNTLIVAATAGTVVTVACNAHTADGRIWGCHRDGDPDQTIGCGWYVDIAHADTVITRYCHMQTEPFVHKGQQVVGGQPIGLVGSTGHSTGPHLHFEIHLRGDASAAGAIDPQPWMIQHGAPLGT
jgi:murein DD-endopeptidase MepM/ murein hydrolase activator NlpD